MAKINATLDTTFFMNHYFSNDNAILTRASEILRRARLQRNRGIVSTIVLAELYALAAKKTGASEAERRFDEIASSGLEIIGENTVISKRAGIIRHRYQEKIPWGDCLIAATGLECGTELILTEDSQFNDVKEIKSRRISEMNI